MKKREDRWHLSANCPANRTALNQRNQKPLPLLVLQYPPPKSSPSSPTTTPSSPASTTAASAAAPPPSSPPSPRGSSSSSASPTTSTSTSSTPPSSAPALSSSPSSTPTTSPRSPWSTTLPPPPPLSSSTSNAPSPTTPSPKATPSSCSTTPSAPSRSPSARTSPARAATSSIALNSSALRGRKVRLAVIDHVTSMPSVVLPVKELVAICREKGVDRVFVDAAHAIGNVDVDVKDIGADFYASNLHKWFFCPPSVAFLYCKKSPTSWDLHHPVVSDLYGNGLAAESGWVGTRDYSAQLVVPAVLDFVSRFEGGIDGIRRRNHQKVVEMGRMLAEAWETCLGSPPEMCCSMVMVGLPGCLGIENEEDASKLRTHLRDKFKIEVPIYYNSLTTGCGEVRNGRSLVTGYARISHQVYNVESDYYRLRDAINDLLQNEVNCRTLSST